MRALVRQILWWAWKNLGRARIEPEIEPEIVPEIVPDPPLHSAQIQSYQKTQKSFFLKARMIWALCRGGSGTTLGTISGTRRAL